MKLHKYTLSLEPPKSPQASSYSPQLKDIINNSRYQQIKQHQTVSPQSPSRNLIARTKRLINYDQPSPPKMSQTMTERMTASVEGRRGLTARLKNSRDGKLSETKRQLQLLNQIYKFNHKDQIKRYQEQIQQQQSEIHTVVAQYRLRRKWGTGEKAEKDKVVKKQNPEEKASQQHSLIRPDIKPQTISSFMRSSRQDPQMDFLFDRMHPYRRILISRRKSKGRVQPWNSSQVN